MTQKLFKIEQQFASEINDNVAAASPQQHNQLMEAIAEVKALLSENSVQTEVPTQIMDGFRNDMVEAAKIKAELMTIQKAIDSTKYEIAALHLPGEETPDITRMSHELSAIVNGTERATEDILTAVEQIDDNINDISASLTIDSQKDLAADVQDQVIKIFEACNFQDLTGQRISKVIRAFTFIEKRVDQMMEIWGGIESFKGFEPQEVKDNGTGHHLLNGPSLGHEDDVANQNDIDALFD